MRQLYIIEFESAHWCGGASHCVAWANNQAEAEEAADRHMDEAMRDLFYDSHEDADDELNDESAYVVNFVKLLAGSGFEEYYDNLQQRTSFYPCVNQE